MLTGLGPWIKHGSVRLCSKVTLLRWIRTVDKGRFKYLVLPPQITGAALLKLSSKGLAELFEMSLRRARGRGEGQAGIQELEGVLGFGFRLRQAWNETAAKEVGFRIGRMVFAAVRRETLRWPDGAARLTEVGHTVALRHHDIMRACFEAQQDLVEYDDPGRVAGFRVVLPSLAPDRRPRNPTKQIYFLQRSRFTSCIGRPTGSLAAQLTTGAGRETRGHGTWALGRRLKLAPRISSWDDQVKSSVGRVPFWCHLVLLSRVG